MARRDSRETKRIKEAIDLFERLMTVTKNEHEMYFLGIQTRPPTNKVRDLKRMLREFEDMTINNTATQFKVRQLRGHFNTYNTMWLRTIKQIEEGTYRRQRFLADKRKPQAQTVNSSEIREQIRALLRGEEPEDSVKTITEEAGIRAPDAPGTPRRKPAVGQKARGHDIESPELVKDFMAARLKVGKSGPVNANALREALRKQAAQIKQRYGAREVRFRVVAEDGKAKVKAIPVK